jgi:large subunit ribosomal protein L7e
MATRYLVKETSAPAGVAVPESLKKKLERNSNLLAKKKAAIAEGQKKNKTIRHNLKMRAAKYEKEYKANAAREVQLRRQAKAAGNFYVESEPKLMFVVRITGINTLAPKPRKILKLLRLDQLHKGVFVKCTKPMLNMLKYIQPYIACGFPNLKTVKELVLKRGYGKVNNQRIPLQDNQYIQQVLGKYGIEGMDDLIHEIFTVGPNFKQANNFLWAFKLQAPRGGFVLKKHGFNEPKGGDWGNREELINGLVRRMM